MVEVDAANPINYAHAACDNTGNAFGFRHWTWSSRLCANIIRRIGSKGTHTHTRESWHASMRGKEAVGLKNLFFLHKNNISDFLSEILIYK